MKYVILIYHNPESLKIWESFTSQQRAAGLREYAALTESLAESGELIVTEALADQSTGRRVASGAGAQMITDAPLAEAKEQLAGFYLIDCADMERAIEIASRIPEASLGLVEVRPVMSYDMPEL
ncbi:MAG TPA: YciI family protein [Streptosporangiaceae bacterium]